MIDPRERLSQLVMPGLEPEKKPEIFFIKRGVKICRFSATNVEGAKAWSTDSDLLVKKVLRTDSDGKYFYIVMIDKILNFDEIEEKPWEELGKTYYVDEAFLENVPSPESEANKNLNVGNCKQKYRESA